MWYVQNISPTALQHLLFHSLSCKLCSWTLTLTASAAIPRRSSPNKTIVACPSAGSACRKCWSRPNFSTATAAATSDMSTRNAWWSGPAARDSTTRAKTSSASAKSARPGLCCKPKTNWASPAPRKSATRFSATPISRSGSKGSCLCCCCSCCWLLRSPSF